MKKIILALTALFILSCNKDAPKQPEHLISENEMTNILYDMALLQAMKSYNTVSLSEKGINPTEYLYKKYKIDSLTLAQNHAYYAADLEKYDEITRKVTERLKAEKEKVAKTKPAGASTPSSGGTPAAQSLNEENRNRQLPLTQQPTAN